ncbi:MAG: hypothetical protein LBC63_09020, partial [Holophagales bacterium]|nr:hypothetical protein [Holophagales bacterium]
MAAKQPTKIKPGKGKAPVAALPADAPRNQAEEVSRIQAPVQDTERPKREPKAKAKHEPKAKAASKAKSSKGPIGMKRAAKPVERGADMKHSASLVPCGADSTSAAPPLTLEVYQAQPIKHAVEQFVDAHHEIEAGQRESTGAG